jgi:hypothetical protein
MKTLHGYSEPRTEKDIKYHIGLAVHRPQTVTNSQYRSGLTIKRSETTGVPQRSESTTRQILHWELKGSPFSRFGFEQGQILVLVVEPVVEVLKFKFPLVHPTYIPRPL